MAQRTRTLFDVLHLIVVTLISLVLIVVLQSGFIFVLFGMMPSIVAYFVDSGPKRSVYQCILVCNFAGMLPTFSEVFQTDSIPETMQTLMGDPFLWFIVYGSAGAGYALLNVCRTLTLIIMTVTNAAKAEQLQEQQKALVEEWGPKIKHWQT